MGMHRAAASNIKGTQLQTFPVSIWFLVLQTVPAPMPTTCTLIFIKYVEKKNAIE